MKESTENKGNMGALVDSPKKSKKADCGSCAFARGSMCRTPDGKRAIVVQKPDGCKRYKKK
jgi:hypothetical protein